MESALQRLALQLGASPAGPGEEVTASLQFERPWPQSVFLLLLIVGLGLIFWLYSNERGASLTYRLMLALIRSSLLLMAVFFLAEAVLVIDRYDLPPFVVVTDNSASMSREDRYESPTAIARATELLEATEQPDQSRFSLARGWLAEDNGLALRELADQHRLRVELLAGTTTRLAEIDDQRDIDDAIEAFRATNADGEQSRLGVGLREILTELRGSPPSAILFLTDGQTTRGESLSEVATLAGRKGVPLLILGVGDETPPRDLSLSDFVVDDLVFVGDIVRFRATLTARGFEGRAITVRLVETQRTEDSDTGDRTQLREVGRLQLDGPPDGSSVPVELEYRPEEIGEYVYQLVIDPLDEEETVENNQLSKIVSVETESIKVLIVEGQPRYEYRYLRNFLERRPETIDLNVVIQSGDSNYNAQDRIALQTFPIATDGEDGLFDYDVIILGDADPLYFSAVQLEGIVEFVEKEGGGIIFTAGDFFNPLSYQSTTLEKLIPVRLEGARNPAIGSAPLQPFQLQLTVQGRSSPIFDLAQEETTAQELLARLPYHYWYFESPRKQPAATVLAEHPSVRGTDGNLPLVAYQFVGAGKSMFVGLDDTWRWRIGVGDRYFGRFWIQALRFMARDRLTKDQPAELTTDRNRYNSDQPVLVRLRFRNEGLGRRYLELNAELKEADEQSAEPLVLRRTAEADQIFEAILSDPQPGSYQVRALSIPEFGDESPSTTFRVDPPADERARIQLNRAELERAATLSGGHYAHLLDADQFLDLVPPARKVPLETDPPISLWDDWRLLSLFLGLLSTEWFLRKRRQMT